MKNRYFGTISQQSPTARPAGIACVAGRSAEARIAGYLRRHQGTREEKVGVEKNVQDARDRLSHSDLVILVELGNPPL